METRLTLRPGMPGTKKLASRYGERLVCARYLYAVRKAGGIWRPKQKLWELSWDAVRARHRAPRRRIIAKAAKTALYTGVDLHIPVDGFSICQMLSIAS